MTLSTYSELKTAIADFLNRDDLTANIPTFISLAEASMNRRLRHWRMEKRSTSTLSERFSDVPTGWLETIRFNVVGKRPLKLVSHAKMMEMRGAANDETGEACYYAHTAGEFELYPTPSGGTSVELLYYTKIPALSDTETSNWLLSEAPDAYLYGALVHTAPYLQEDARLAVWGGLYGDTINGLEASSKQAQHSGTGLARR